MLTTSFEIADACPTPGTAADASTTGARGRRAHAQQRRITKHGGHLPPQPSRDAPGQRSVLRELRGRRRVRRSHQRPRAGKGRAGEIVLETRVDETQVSHRSVQQATVEAGTLVRRIDGKALVVCTVTDGPG